MKKILTSIMVVALSLTMTGCSSKSSLDSYVKEIEKQVEDEMKAYEDQGLFFDLIADGNRLVYKYTYDESIVIDHTVVAENLQNALNTDENTKIYVSIYEEAKKEVSKIDSVDLEYYTHDDDLIYSISFPK